MSKKAKNTSNKIEIAEGKRIVFEEKTRTDAASKLRKLREQAFSQGLFHEAGGVIQFVRKDYLDAGRFVVVVTFYK